MLTKVMQETYQWECVPVQRSLPVRDACPFLIDSGRFFTCLWSAKVYNQKVPIEDGRHFETEYITLLIFAGI